MCTELTFLLYSPRSDKVCLVGHQYHCSRNLWYLPHIKHKIDGLLVRPPIRGGEHNHIRIHFILLPHVWLLKKEMVFKKNTNNLIFICSEHCLAINISRFCQCSSFYLSPSPFLICLTGKITMQAKSRSWNLRSVLPISTVGLDMEECSNYKSNHKDNY